MALPLEIFGLGKNLLDYFRKFIYFYFRGFFLIWGFVSKILKNSLSDKKNLEFYTDLKM
jgi:hypothetical protein